MPSLVILLVVYIWKYIFRENKFGKNVVGGSCSAYEEDERRIQSFGGKHLGRPRRRWEDNIKLDLQEVGCGVMAQNRDR
jgi:hypothetical protein